MAKIPLIPLPTTPVSLRCPYCNARPGKDCSTSSGGFAVVHTARILAALDKDASNNRKPKRA